MSDEILHNLIRDLHDDVRDVMKQTNKLEGKLENGIKDRLTSITEDVKGIKEDVVVLRNEVSVNAARISQHMDEEEEAKDALKDVTNFVNGMGVVKKIATWLTAVAGGLGVLYAAVQYLNLG